jgi:hypothetical protein
LSAHGAPVIAEAIAGESEGCATAKRRSHTLQTPQSFSVLFLRIVGRVPRFILVLVRLSLVRLILVLTWLDLVRLILVLVRLILVLVRLVLVRLVLIWLTNIVRLRSGNV